MRPVVAGGYGSGQSALSSIEEGDPATGQWKTVGNLPTRRGDVFCATVNNLFYVAGGYFDPTGARPQGLGLGSQGASEMLSTGCFSFVGVAGCWIRLVPTLKTIWSSVIMQVLCAWKACAANLKTRAASPGMRLKPRWHWPRPVGI